MRCCAYVSLVVLLAAAGLLVSDSSVVGDRDPTRELLALYEANLKATQAEDEDAVLKTMHSGSPAVESTRQALKTIFATYDLQYQLLSLKHLVTEGGYAIARVSQKTTKKSGPKFRDNTMLALCIFKKEKEVWKLFQQVVLEVQYQE